MQRGSVVSKDGSGAAGGSKVVTQKPLILQRVACLSRKPSSSKTSLPTFTEPITVCVPGNRKRRTTTTKNEESTKKKKKRQKKVKKPTPPSGTWSTNFKDLKTPSLMQLKRLLDSSDQREWVGLDMSLTSPGICLINPSRKTIQLFGFRQNQKMKSGCSTDICPDSPFQGWLVQVVILEEPEEKIEDHCLFRFSNYEVRLRTVMSILGPARKDRLVTIEGYAFQSMARKGKFGKSAKATEADTKLKELGGLMRFMLLSEGHQVMEIPPCSAKRIFSGKGHCTKEDMYCCFRERYQLPNLFGVMNMEGGTRSWDQGILVDKNRKVPHPIEDMVDAVALVVTGMVVVEQIGEK